MTHSVTIYNVKVDDAVVVPEAGTSKARVFFYDISFDDRAHLSDKGVPIYYDPSTKQRYLWVDLAAVVGYHPISNLVCECGVDSIKSGGKHSDYCPKFETPDQPLS